MHRNSWLSHSSRAFRSPSPLSMPHRAWLLAGALCLLVVLALAGCGVTATTSVGGGAGKSSTPQPPMKGGNGSIATSLNPCPGMAGAPAQPPTLVLTGKDAHKTTLAHVGDVIEVRLSSQMHWSAPSVGTSAALAQLQTQGGIDSATQTCHWLYAAKTAGTAKLDFVGTPLCEGGTSPCSMIAVDEEFTIQVS